MARRSKTSLPDVGAQAREFADELRLALRWERPLILFAVSRSPQRLLEAQEVFGKQVLELGQAVKRVEVNDTDYSDVAARLSRHPRRHKTVFFIAGLARGGEAALKALNVRREYFVDNRLRVVFLLTEAEERAIANRAPDFWAFRHRALVVHQLKTAGSRRENR